VSVQFTTIIANAIFVFGHRKAVRLVGFCWRFLVVDMYVIVVRNEIQFSGNCVDYCGHIKKVIDANGSVAVAK
jgi:hypothetical protein